MTSASWLLSGPPPTFRGLRRANQPNDGGSERSYDLRFFRVKVLKAYSHTRPAP